MPLDLQGLFNTKVLGDLLALHDLSNFPFMKPIMQYVVEVIIAF